MAKPLADRILACISIDAATGCWNFMGYCDKDGYGQLTCPNGKSGGKNFRAHRIAAHVWLGFDLKSPLRICHHCDNPPCCNPDHLFIGTEVDNTQDAIRKGRKFQSIKKIHCKHGHEFTPENTIWQRGGRRECRECHYTLNRKYYHRRKINCVQRRVIC